MKNSMGTNSKTSARRSVCKARISNLQKEAEIKEQVAYRRLVELDEIQTQIEALEAEIQRTYEQEAKTK